MNPRALVCDDDPQIRRSMEVLLGSEGYEVVSAATAEEALDAAATQTPDVAIVDLSLPGKDGIWLCERLREWSDLPILVLSVVDEEPEKVRALQAGADDYVTKPFGKDELLARLHAIVRRAANGDEPESVVTADGLEIDLAGRTVRRDGERVSLTPTELRLLGALVRGRGRLLTHRQLLTDVWGIESADDVHLLRVQMVGLRRKVEREPSRPALIVTEPGLGYRFIG
ncbi:MAG TPA: response regulator transcription factor [Solirubrobacterales bacterium]